MSNEKKKHCPWELWVLFSFGIAVIATTGFSGLIYLTSWPPLVWEWLFGGYIDPQQSNYLLSATAQVLGALFALVFSITLIAVQFVTKYTHRTMKIIFDGRLFFYMGGFACSVILPLWWLLYPTEIGTFASLITGSLVVGSLILLFRDLRKRMNIRWAIDRIKDDGLKALPEHPEKAEENINALDNIAMGAYTDRNFEVFELAYAALAEFALGIKNKYEKLKDETDEKRLHESVFKRLKDTCEEVIDNPRAPIRLLDQIGKVSAEAMNKQHYRICEMAFHLINEIQKECNSYERRKVSIACAGALHFIAVSVPSTIKESELESAGKVYYSITRLEMNLYMQHLNNLWFEDLWDEIDHTLELIQFYLRHPYLNLWSSPLNHLFKYIDKFIDKNYSIGGHVFEGVSYKLVKFTVLENPSRRFASELATKLKTAGERCISYYSGNPMWKLIGEKLVKTAEPLDIMLGHKSNL